MGDRATPLVLGDQARLEQLEPAEEAEDLIPAPRPDRPGVSVIGARLAELARARR